MERERRERSEKDRRNEKRRDYRKRRASWGNGQTDGVGKGEILRFDRRERTGHEPYGGICQKEDRRYGRYDGYGFFERFDGGKSRHEEEE